MSRAAGTAGAVGVDMVTALELKLDDENEAKFTALKNLNMKKMKAMMASIEAKDKEIAKLKILGKDNRRAQMIQELRKKIRTHEVINDLLKEELHRRVELTPQETNDMIIRKTLAGPKRFRPLSREEMENKILELEKKLSKKSSAAAATIDSGGENIEVQEKKAKAEHLEPNSSKKEAVPVAGAAAQVTGSGEHITKIVSLVEEIDELKRQLSAKDNVLDLQREEIIRLKARNAQLVAVEEEIENHEQQYQHLKSVNNTLATNLEESTARLAAALETSMKLKSDVALTQEDHQAEVISLQKECEKLLKQNAMLLRSIGELEVELDEMKKENGELNKSIASLNTSVENKSYDAKTLNEKLRKNEEKIKMLEGKIASLEGEMVQIPQLKEQLREKNIQMKELKRNIGVRDRIGRSASSAYDPTADAKHDRYVTPHSFSEAAGEEAADAKGYDTRGADYSAK